MRLSRRLLCIWTWPRGGGSKAAPRLSQRQCAFSDDGQSTRGIPRRAFLHLAAVGAGLPPTISFAWAQAYPTRPVRVIVSFAPGGPTDVLARLVAQKLSQSFGQQFYVENQGGAGGNLGMGAGARAIPDGYTITAVSGSYVVNPSLYSKIPYDPHKDFAPVTLAAVSPNVLVTHPSIPADNVQELIALLRANPGKYSFAHPGTGTTSQLSGELFKQSQNLDIVPVPFNGSAPAIQAALAGHTLIAFAALTPAIPHVKDGRLRALAVTTPKRSPALPDVPTLAEAGLPNQESDTMFGILVPAHTPEPVITLLHREISNILTQPGIEEKLASLGFEATVSTPHEFAARIENDISRWAKVIQAANIKPE
jgi:tripartite-type tricarboxylate transporter receptor subunit TctC